MYKPKITIGVLPTRRGMLDLEIATKEKDRFMSIIKKIKPRIVKFVDIDDICQNGIIANEKHSLKVVEKFHDANIDAIFIPFCDFGEEGAVVDVASKFDVPVLVWARATSDPISPKRAAVIRNAACLRLPRFCNAMA